MPEIVTNPLGWLHDVVYAALATFLPGWLVALILALIGGVIVVSVVPVLVMAQVYFERKILAKAQDRYGPNRVGPFGVLQPVADALKLLAKEDILPARADAILFGVAPILVLSASLMIWAVLPFGPGVVVADVDVSLIFVVAMGAMTSIGFIVAGWSSNNKYALLGGMRAVAQFVSYEIPQILILIVPVLLAGSVSLSQIVQVQLDRPLLGFLPGWFALYPVIGWLAFLIFLIAGLAESNRTPFDLVEAESELGAGFHTEYSGMRFALFFLAEYANMFAISLVGSALFLGGWDAFGLENFVPGFLIMIVKAQILVFVMMWIRSTLPRLRYDQLMYFAWKRLLPMSLVTIALAGLWVAFMQTSGS